MTIDPRRASRRRLPLLLTITAVAVAIPFVRCNGFTIEEYWRESRSGTVRAQADTRETVVALTFDDGPDPRYTPRILNVLRRYNVRATFFEEARFVESHPEISRRVAAEGHCIGNHTVTHPYLDREPPTQVHAEIVGCDAVFARILHIRTHLFRPPRGWWNPTIYREVERDGDHMILWSVALEHHDVPAAKAMADRALGQLRPGGILLMHDGGSAPRETTVEALPMILEGLRRAGYRCVTVPELLHISGDEPIPGAH